jgi:hypothetical protein
MTADAIASSTTPAALRCPRCADGITVHIRIRGWERLIHEFVTTHTRLHGSMHVEMNIPLPDSGEAHLSC